jgi:hypothetical protein
MRDVHDINCNQLGGGQYRMGLRRRQRGSGQYRLKRQRGYGQCRKSGNVQRRHYRRRQNQRGRGLGSLVGLFLKKAGQVAVKKLAPKLIRVGKAAGRVALREGIKATPQVINSLARKTQAKGHRKTAAAIQAVNRAITKELRK